MPPPPNGFVLPFTMHSLGKNRVAVLDAGGLPQPQPFVPANPKIYEYAYSLSPEHGFSVSLVCTIVSPVCWWVSGRLVRLDDDRYLLSDAVLGSIWVVNPDGTVVPGIVPEKF